MLEVFFGIIFTMLTLLMAFLFGTVLWTLYKLHKEDPTDWNCNLYSDPTFTKESNEQYPTDQANQSDAAIDNI